MNLKYSFLAVALIVTALTSNAADFFSTGAPDKLFSLGARIGVNTSNQSISKKVFNDWNATNWGTGFTAGIVAPINFRDFFAIEPGFFFESRSGNYAYAASETIDSQDVNSIMEYGKYRLYNFSIPVMAKVRFNVTNKVVWSIEAGPYFTVRLNTTGKNMIFDGTSTEVAPATFGKRKGGDWGFKFGSGLLFFKHLYVGIHYSAGAMSVWKEQDLGGRNKSWSFTAGWDL